MPKTVHKHKQLSPEEFAASVEARYPGMIDKMRSMSQRDVAREYNISGERVRQRRVRLGIPSYQQRYSDERFEEAKALIGTMSDQAVATRLGMSATTVWLWRKQLNIPVFKDQNADFMRVEAAADRIGRETDYAIAKDLNVHPQLVRRLRRKLNIEAVGFRNNPTGGRKK